MLRVSMEEGDSQNELSFFQDGERLAYDRLVTLMNVKIMFLTMI